MDVHVSLVGRRDLSAEIYRQLRAAILDGRLRGGQRLPPTRELARQLSVARTTVTVAFDRLISEGFATARLGSGTFVSRHLDAGRVRRSTFSNAPPRAGSGALRARDVWASVRVPATFAHEAPFDFRSGVPDARFFPHDAWRGLVARQHRAEAVGRGVYGHPAGHPWLREQIARHIGIARGVGATADDVVVTNGTQQAVDLIARTLLSAGDRVAFEDPGYLPLMRLFTTLGLRVSGVPVDREGLVVDAIPRDARLVYVSPSHQFPLGVSMSLPRRLALLEWAKRHDAAIIEDDYDSEFRFGGRPIEPLQTLDTSGRVIYVGSFSKTMLPTLRLGFLVSPPSIGRAIQAAKFLADWHTSLPIQAALAEFIERGLFARHVRRMRSVYQSRHERITAVLCETLADELDAIPSSVGLHLSAVARRASVERIDAVLSRASADGVECQPLAGFAVGEAATPGLVLGCGAIAADRIDEGLDRLRRCFAALPQPDN